MNTSPRTGLLWYSGMLVLLLLKLLLFRWFVFKDIEWGRIIWDVISVAGLLALLELSISAKVRPLVYWMFNGIISILLFASVVYVAYFGSVPTYTALSGLGQVNQVKGSVHTLLRPEQFLFFIDLAALLVARAARAVAVRRRHRSALSFGTREAGKRPSKLWKLSMALILISSLGLSAVAMTRSWTIENEKVRAEQLGFVSYQVAEALRDARDTKALADTSLEETAQKVQELKASYTYQDKTESRAEPDYFGSGEGMNLLIVQLESLQRFPLHAFLDGQEITPVMNTLADEGLYFPNVFQQIGQGNTSDAEFLTNTSIYPAGSIAMSKGFGHKQLPSLPKLLAERNYISSTFHVNDAAFWNRAQLYPALGFDQYYDKPSFNNDQFNDFGASDEEMYRTGLQKLIEVQETGKSFYGHFIAVSSHSPFIVPEDRSKIDIPAELQGTQLGHYLDAVNYSDYALGLLVDALKQKGLWENTVLVVYGDHFGINPAETPASLISSTLNIPYEDDVSRLNVPLVIRIPGQQGGKTIERTGGQIDILPTVANIMGISLEKEGFTAFGQDLLNIDHNVTGMRYYLPTGSFLNDEILFIPGNGFEDGRAVSLDTLEPVEDFSAYRNDYDFILQIMKLSDEYVNLLPSRAP
ncbi:arylsulfatase [Paenibacillus algicola]|uniref:Arylsulfatase n=1 Tax=Paenibacillus algicola TaxID=2565926 RepID=A0A4P8XMF7_9BACL|nr:LTA synthase family protein [Paenibacillus algicola]QCT02860.1 arylsulfatase [Paenibacillus algicola]